MKDSLYQKYLRGEIKYSEYRNDLERRRGFKNESDYRNHLAKRKGFKNGLDYLNDIKKKQGYENFGDYRKERLYLTGKSIPMDQNLSCSNYLGIYIAESLLCKIFEDIKRMPFGHVGYDFICKNGFKIDIKSSCLNNSKSIKNMWRFNIEHNNIADYFLLIGFDDRIRLNPLHIWLIKSDVIVKDGNKKITDFFTFSIKNDNKGLSSCIKYELKDKIDDAIKICSNFKGDLNENLNVGIDYKCNEIKKRVVWKDREEVKSIDYKMSFRKGNN